MPRSERSTEAHRKKSNEGTSARTRPFSFEEIMLRRRKKLAADSKGGASDLRGLSEKVDAKGDSDRPDSDGDYKSMKFSNDMEKGSSKKIEETVSRKGYHLEGKDKGNYNAEANTKGKLSHSKSNRDKESKNEKLSYHRSSTGDRLGADSERGYEKKRPKDAVEKDKHEERERKSRKEEKKKHISRMDEKSRSEYDGSYPKKNDYDKLRDTEYSERDDRKKERSQPYNDEPRSKRRRSRSPEYNREREKRSISVSPRAQKRSYHGRDYGDSLSQSYKDKSRKYFDADKYRSGNGGYSSGQYRKHGSGLGGYSPRKRKSEAAVKTPSPTVRSPERKSTTWDQPPAGTSNADSASMLANFQSTVTVMHELVSSISVTPAVTKPQPTPSIDAPSMALNATTDSIQLTQATRPMRRLYIENLPPSASDKTLTDSLNDFLQSSGVSHIQGTKPCISCIINKEKSQAVVEFLTPEDATIALSFDGRSLSGSVLKIRRPKDFVEAAAGASEIPVAASQAISDVVKDSPHKIFIGGISPILSSDMFLEIVSAFGLLRAYHFELNEELNGSFAFLEYVDHSITLKACAGLNGMKLGGHVLTAVQAIPDSHGEEESTDAAASYVIPEHAKPLLADPTQVLQLKNVFNREELLLLLEPELEETMEDIRLECARFGTVKSVNIVRDDHGRETATEVIEQDLINDSCKMESGVESPNNDSKQNGDVPPSNDIEELENVRVVAEDADSNNKGAMKDLQKNESTNTFMGVATNYEEPLHLGDSSGDPPSVFDRDADDKRSGDPSAVFDRDAGDKAETSGAESGLVSEMPKPEEVDTRPPEDGDSNIGVLDKAEVIVGDGDGECMPIESTNLGTTATDEVGISNDDCDHLAHDLYVFEPGCVLVEFVRADATCMAAHCLHGRLYGERIVTVGYVPHELYLAQFPR